MDFKTLRSENFVNGLKGKKDTIFSVFMFVMFFAIAIYYSLSLVVGESDIGDYATISLNPYERYERMMSGEGIKGLVGNKQFGEYKYNDKLDNLIKKSTPNSRDNLFDETF